METKERLEINEWGKVDSRPLATGELAAKDPDLRIKVHMLCKECLKKLQESRKREGMVSVIRVINPVGDNLPGFLIFRHGYCLVSCLRHTPLQRFLFSNGHLEKVKKLCRKCLS